MGTHPVFNEGPKVSASDMLWSEFQACIRMGIDPEDMFKKDRHMRMMIVGGIVADSAIANMRSYDVAKEREVKDKK